MTGYTFTIENGAENFAELEPLYRQHYAETQERLAKEGAPIGDFNMRLEVYFDYWRKGYLLNYVARHDGKAVGYGNVYVTHDMHNCEFIATEDSLYVVPEHRNGTGRLLTKFLLADLKARGCKRLAIDARTDPRAVKLWQRLGARLTGYTMTFNL